MGSYYRGDSRMTARTSPDRPAGGAPVAPAVAATSPAIPGWHGDVAPPGLPVSGPPKAGRPGTSSPAPVTETSTVTGAGQVPVAGKNAAAVDGKVTLPRPASGKPPRASDGTPVSVRLPAELLAALREHADKNSVTVSDALRDGALMLLGFCPTCGHKTPGPAAASEPGPGKDR